MNNFLNLNEITSNNLEAILEDACKVKKATLGGSAVKERIYSSCLDGTLTGLLFKSYLPERVYLLEASWC